jgi:hypothetical protein
MAEILKLYNRLEPNPHRAKDIVLARPGDVFREACLRQEMDLWGIKPVRGSSLQTWVETLQTGQADGSGLSNSTVETSIIPSAAIYTLPANYWYIGRALRFTLKGRLSSATSSPGTLRLLIRYGGVSSGIILADSVAATIASSLANNTWFWRGEIVCRAVGSGTSSNAMTIAEYAGITETTGLVKINPASAPAVTSGFDSTTATQINVSAIFGTASASNSLTLHEYVLESLN